MLSNMIVGNEREAASDDEDDSDDERRFHDKSSKKGRARSGKVGIRDGLLGHAGGDDDEYA
jgi:hypothetical protein